MTHLTSNGSERSFDFDMDALFFDDMIWLTRQADVLPAERFKEIGVVLTPELWTKFWQIVRQKTKKKLCIIDKRVKELTDEEMGVVSGMLGKPTKSSCWIY